MRRIFPARSGEQAPGKQPGKKDKSSEFSLSSSSSSSSSSIIITRRESFRNKQQQQQQGDTAVLLAEKPKREHWCPASHGLIATQRCETPPSGDENNSHLASSATPGDDDSSSSNNNNDELLDSGMKPSSISQTRLGLPDECQDKQVLRPSIVATSRGSSPSPSPEAFEWTSGLQAALDQLVIESRQELRRKFISEPPSPATSPPPIEERSHADVKPTGRALKAIKLEPESHPESEASSRLSHPMNFSEVDDRVSQELQSMVLPRLTRSLSRSSNDGASILSNPRSHSFSDWSRGGGVASSDNFSSRETLASSEEQVSSREKSHFKYLNARAVAEKLAKAIRGNSSKSKELKRLPPLPQTPPRSFGSSGSHSSANNNKVVTAIARAGGDNQRLANRLQIERRPKPGVTKHESDFFKRQLESHSTQINFIYDNLSERVCRAERQLSGVEAEVKTSAPSQGDRNATRLSTRELERLDALHRKIKKLQREKSELAREVVAEVRLRSMERLTVREVVELMKRDTEFWIKSLEQDKLELEKNLERTGGNDSVQKLAEEKSWLERELVGVTAKESALRQKVREFELQMQAHVSRVESAERTILGLRESLVSGQKKMIQLEQEDEQLRKLCREKEGENSDLRKLVGRLQQLCSDHEKSIRGLWDSLRSLSHDRGDQKVGKLQAEVLRLSEVELGLRRELEASRAGVKQGSELQENVRLLASKLQESLEAQRKQQQEISGLIKQNEELQRKQMDEKPCSSGQQQQYIIDGLQQSLGDMTHALNTQNSRIQRLTGRNEELYKLYNTKEKEFHELQARAREENETRKTREDEHKQLRDNLKNLQSELQVQQLHCNMLKEKVAGRELELEQCRAELGDSAQGRRMLQDEVSRLRRLVENSTQRISELEHQVREKEQKLGAFSSELRPCAAELNRLREEMPRVIRQRDCMKLEAEQLGREALRMSAEAEVLRRRVHELEEEVMLRDGHLSILRGSLNNDEDC